jgi:membrane protease YdiL (CAAX protease family)
MAGARRWWPIAAMVTGLLLVNVVSNEVLSPGWYVPWAVASSAAIAAFALVVDGRSWTDLGLGRQTLGRGLRWGGVLAGLVLVVLVIGYLLPPTHDLYLDERVRGWSLGRSLEAALLRVPFGTVLLEEVAFRGVLPAMLLVRTTKPRAVLASAALFGLWHILPALGLGDRNPVTEDALGGAPGWVPVALAVVSTAGVGIWFWWLRDRSRSLLTPMAMHWSTNALGYLFAYVAWQRA